MRVTTIDDPRRVPFRRARSSGRRSPPRHEDRPLSERPVRFVRPPAAVLQELKLDFPLVAPTIAGGHLTNERTMFDGRRALEAGLSYRPLSETGLATLEWWRAQTPERRAAAAKYWPTTEQEKAVLEHMSRT